MRSPAPDCARDIYCGGQGKAMTTEEKRAESRRRTDSRLSGETFIREGIRLQQDNRDFARLNFHLAEKCFADAGDHWNALIARRWQSSVASLELV